jgi:hypothetical protein
MRALQKPSIVRKNGCREGGFSVLEMLIASVILMVGILSVVQLVPASLKSSIGNRMDTMATVIAQHELDQMLSQPLTNNPNPSFMDANGNSVSLGGPGAPGAAVVMYGQSVLIDFSAAPPPPGFYIANYVDPNDHDPAQTGFELRWAVYTQTSNGKVVGRRIIIGCRRSAAAAQTQLLLPVTLDTSVSLGN